MNKKSPADDLHVSTTHLQKWRLVQKAQGRLSARRTKHCSLRCSQVGCQEVRCLQR